MSLFFTLVLLLPAVFANGILYVKANNISEGMDLEVYFKCREADNNVVTITLYSHLKEDNAVFGPSGLSCNQCNPECAVTIPSGNIKKTGIYKVVAEADCSTMDPCYKEVYVNITPQWFSIPESHLEALLAAFVVIVLISRKRNKKH